MGKQLRFLLPWGNENNGSFALKGKPFQSCSALEAPLRYPTRQPLLWLHREIEEIVGKGESRKHEIKGLPTMESGLSWNKPVREAWPCFQAESLHMFKKNVVEPTALLFGKSYKDHLHGDNLQTGYIRVHFLGGRGFLGPFPDPPPFATQAMAVVPTREKNPVGRP